MKKQDFKIGDIVTISHYDRVSLRLNTQICRVVAKDHNTTYIASNYDASKNNVVRAHNMPDSAKLLENSFLQPEYCVGEKVTIKKPKNYKFSIPEVLENWERVYENKIGTIKMIRCINNCNFCYNITLQNKNVIQLDSSWLTKFPH